MTRKNFIQTATGALGAAALSQAGDVRKPGGEGADVYPVPPLARKNDAKRSLDIRENDKLFHFLLGQGMKRIVFGGNALVYHLTMREYSELIEWLSGLTDKAEIMPGIGPAYGRAMDHAAIVRKHRFPSLLALPNGDPRDAGGLETGYREIAHAAGIPLSLYVKDETSYGTDKEAGLDVIGRLVDSKVCVSIKYAVVRKNPAEDPYLRGLLKRVDPSFVISGIGERPAIVHMRDFKLPGFTTGSGVVAPALSLQLFQACVRQDYAKAEEVRQLFMPLEDLRDTWGPPRVLHHAVASAGVAETGPLSPFVGPLTAAQLAQLKPVAEKLFRQNASA